MTDCLLHELTTQQDFLNHDPVETLYIGGGTPSVLSPSALDKILQHIHSLYRISSNAEITLEANPDDLTASYLKDLWSTGINRLSIGVQSFFDEHLQWMNRRHSAAEAESSVKLSQDCGFHNLNIDLIYGLPSLSSNQWRKSLEKFTDLRIPHLSAYHLTIEPKTVFGYYKRKGKLTETAEEKSIEHYQILTSTLSEYGYQHYEISNFCMDGSYSRHNLNYWRQGNYLGIGPSAHSYNGIVRRWNAAINTTYMTAMEHSTTCFKEEILSDTDHFNDYLLTGLRTIWGIDTRQVKTIFGENFLMHLEKELYKYLSTDLVSIHGSSITLSEKGMFVSDKIISDLFMI